MTKLPSATAATLAASLNNGCDERYFFAVATILLCGVDTFFRAKLEALLRGHHLVTSDSVDLPDLVIADISRVDPEEVALARVGDDFYATQQHCIHLQGPLGEGWLEGCVLTCPWHGWEYDVRTGENTFDLAIKLQTYEVEIQDGEIRVRT